MALHHLYAKDLTINTTTTEITVTVTLFDDSVQSMTSNLAFSYYWDGVYSRRVRNFPVYASSTWVHDTLYEGAYTMNGQWDRLAVRSVAQVDDSDVVPYSGARRLALITNQYLGEHIDLNYVKADQFEADSKPLLSGFNFNAARNIRGLV